MRIYCFYLFLFVLLSLLFSCTTYYIPLDSFKQQFAAFDSTDMRTVMVEGPLGGRVTYSSYPIDTIKCIDKHGMPKELVNGPSIEIRFTRTNGKKTIFYFDLLRVTDSTVSGTMSRFIPAIKNTIPFREIKKIEVQDGKKNFHYVAG